MNRTKKQCLAKKTLAMVMAVAMVVTMVPSTAAAATEEPMEIAENDEGNANTSLEGTMFQEEDSEEPKDVGIVNGSDDEADEDSTLEEHEDGGETNQSQEIQPSDESTITAGDEPPTDDLGTDAETGELQTANIYIDNFSALEDNDFKINYSGEGISVVNTVYSDEKEDPFRQMVEELQSGYIHGVSGENEDISEQLIYEWQQRNGDGDYVPMDVSVPVNVGDYRLKIFVEENLFAAEPRYIAFVIEKAELYIKVDEDRIGNACFNGMTVGEAKKIYADAVGVSLKREEQVQDKYLQFVRNLKVTVQDSFNEETLADTEVLRKGNDYLVKITADAGDTANYNAVNRYETALTVTGSVPVTVEITLNDTVEWGITYLYGEEVKSPFDATAAADKKAAVRVIIDGVPDETTGEDKELPVVMEGENRNIVGTWLDANKNEMAEEPKNAGVYWYQITFMDPAGIYADCSEIEQRQIKIVVLPAKILVRPDINGSQTYTVNAGTETSELLKNVTYKLLGKNAQGVYEEESAPPEGDTFWGVSYNNPDKPQYYKPVFHVQKRITTDITEDNPEGTSWEWEEVPEILEDVSGESVDSDGVKEKIEYRIVFQGERGLYKDGKVLEGTIVSADEQTAINSANTNYEADITPEIVEAKENTVELTVKAGTEVTIHTDDIVGLMKPDVNGVYSKIYDGKAFFAERSDYQKARTDVAEANKAENFIYEWYSFDMVVKTDEKGDPVKDSEGNVIKTLQREEKIINYNIYYKEAFCNAGRYCLRISYKDPANIYTAQPVELYFQIAPRRIGIVPQAGKTLKAFWGTPIKDFLEEVEKKENDGSSIEVEGDTDGSMKAKLEALDREIKEEDASDYLYKINWAVAEGDREDSSEAVYNRMITGENGETFQENLPYMLAAELEWNPLEEYKRYRQNYVIAYGPNQEDNAEKYFAVTDIEMTKMSDVKLKISLDMGKLPVTSVVYDGERHFTEEELIQSGCVTVTNEEDPNTPLTIGSGEGQIPLVFEWDTEDGAEPLHAGRYTLTVKYPGDDKYAYAIGEKVPQFPGDVAEPIFVIEARKITVTMKMALEDDDITAGLDLYYLENREQLIDSDSMTVAGVPEADYIGFAVDETTGVGKVKEAPAIWGYVGICEKGEEDYENYNHGYLRTGKEYSAKLIGGLRSEELKDGRPENYDLVCQSVSFTTGKRGSSTVKNATIADHDEEQGTGSQRVIMSVKATVPAYLKMRVTSLGGIPYFYEKPSFWPDDEEMTFVPGNYLVFDMEAPRELAHDYDGYYENDYRYSDEICRKFVYQSSIEKCGGYVLKKAEDPYSWYGDWYEDELDWRHGIGTIRVAFPVSEDDRKRERKFQIRWENGFTEEYTVDLAAALLEADLQTAVTPKTLAFRDVNTKMAVGETQQLNVKMTKVLNSDVVYLHYKVTEGAEYACVDEKTGIITALGTMPDDKPAKVTVSVYPVKRNSKGAFEKMDYKKVTAKITVNRVTAPKIKSVHAYDNRFELQYTRPGDGYRREIYVLAGGSKPKLTAQDFEERIKKAQQGGKNNFEAYFTAWQYADESSFDAKQKTVTESIGGVNPGTEYTVYVRNVSGVRTLANGAVVSASAAGTVKAFKTTKAQLLSIRLDYADENEQAKMTPEEQRRQNSYDEIKLSQKSVRIKAVGEYERQTGNGDMADGISGSTHVWKDLSEISKDDPVYEMPKLRFYALDHDNGYTKAELAKDKRLKGYTMRIGDKYYRPSNIAKIDKKGNLTLKGVGRVYLLVCDSVSGIDSSRHWDWDNEDTENVDNSLEVNQDGWYKDYTIEITAAVSKFTAKNATLKVGSSISGNYLTYYEETGKKLEGATVWRYPVDVNANDSEYVEVVGGYSRDMPIAKKADGDARLTVSLRGKPQISADMEVKTKQMDPVKSLKASDVNDHSATITFTHSGHFVREFRIDVRDDRKRLVRSRYETLGPVKGLSDWVDLYAYQYRLDELNRQSVYYVEVTPFYEGESGKTMRVKFKTTNIPASACHLEKDDRDIGMDIYIDGYDSTLDRAGYLTSGNAYTLIADANRTAMTRQTDTLIWKSTNSRVASVKANAGSFTATLKAASVGYTDIEVTSKATRKVIARWGVRVKSVSNGGKSAYGDAEPIDHIEWDPYYDQGVEVLTEKNPAVFVTPGGRYDYRWLSFTAPADGEYAFICSSAELSNYYHKMEIPDHSNDETEEDWEEDWEEDPEGKEDYRTAGLGKGQTIYFRAFGTVQGGKAQIEVEAP